jgi:hypothetical protein
VPGYCIEGDRCAYDHGENPVVVNADTHSVPEVVQKLPPAIANRLPPALASRLSAQPPSSFDDEYKPESVLPQDLARELNNNYRSQAPLAPGLYKKAIVSPDYLHHFYYSRWAQRIDCEPPRRSQKICVSRWQALYGYIGIVERPC